MSSTPATTLAASRPLWQRLLLRRLKFLLGVIVILALALGGSYLFAPQWLLRADIARQAMAAHLESKTVQAGDTRWSYYEGGEGTTLVLLHGYDSSKEVWLEVAKELSGANPTSTYEIRPIALYVPEARANAPKDAIKVY